ncbi:hypothetical protein [Mycobacterium sp. NPDC006124]|uniref:hypothetical protein n=1 Tax=Mycobacterium sp. NPDC006124 TaxID=3156729 RepID=UPI0033BD01F7
MFARIAIASTLVAGALPIALLTGGTAAADDYAGQSYADASKAAGDAKQTVVVASRVGDAEAQDDCSVERSQSAPFIHGTDFSHETDTVQFYLNCNAGVATATTPGNSAASPEGRAAIAAAADKAAKDKAAAAAAG